MWDKRLRELKKRWFELVLESRSMQLPEDVNKWIDDNKSLILGVVTTLGNKRQRSIKLPYRIGSVRFRNPYGIDPHTEDGLENPYGGKGMQEITVYVVNSKMITEKTGGHNSEGLYVYEDESIYLNWELIGHSVGEIRTLLMHEFLHAIDPKMIRNIEVNDSYGLGHPNSVLEFDQYCGHILEQIESGSPDLEGIRKFLIYATVDNFDEYEDYLGSNSEIVIHNLSFFDRKRFGIFKKRLWNHFFNRIDK